MQTEEKLPSWLEKNLMVKVLITKQSNYPVKTPAIKKRLSDFFKKQGIVSDAEVSVAIVGEKKMMEIGDKFLKDGKLHNVLSFVTEEEKKEFIYPPDGKIRLGEIAVCYPLAVKEAIDEDVLIDERIYELVEHGAMHLMGIHHKE